MQHGPYRFTVPFPQADFEQRGLFRAGEQRLKPTTRVTARGLLHSVEQAEKAVLLRLFFVFVPQHLKKDLVRKHKGDPLVLSNGANAAWHFKEDLIPQLRRKGGFDSLALRHQTVLQFVLCSI
ncbi:hypothetical protein SDC9_158940 [bioreactor metagenome]|uniref:Uncharacterized protein n=1 Tax=bioreactor metagenome TaxID=1076179 RepID=A0A645FDH4_9ZZZZ